ncbi:hypothetical protein HF521_022032 [Silurus meridionalis]|uniref:Uncharacterized protein n=1 Tax=Silurus meridionalis TaxID=175797 RepID=A0A8T0B8F0_SILME|nr:hypothetical protein HF521_022032 [Silurus meridionalis]
MLFSRFRINPSSGAGGESRSGAGGRVSAEIWLRSGFTCGPEVRGASLPHLKPGSSPKIDDVTQEPENCKDLGALVECLPAPNISCLLQNGTRFKFSGEEVGFNKTIPCRNVSLLSGLSSSRAAKVLHCGFLWNRKPGGLHLDINADRRSIRRFGLHRGLLRREARSALHNK